MSAESKSNLSPDFTGKTQVNLPTQQMVCMEVWGGNSATNRQVELLGLDAWLFNQPYQQSAGGGDVYYLSSCASGRITRLLLADVSGHGSAVAETASRLRDLMRCYINHIKQSRFVRSMNVEFSKLSHSGGFATAVVATFFAPLCELTLSNAGHPPPLVFRDSTQTWHLFDMTGKARSGQPADLPLGIYEDGDYSEFQLGLEPKDLVLIYSDAVIESRSSTGELLGAQGLLQLISQLKSKDPTELLTELRQVVAGLFPGNLTEDDVTLLLIRPTDRIQQVPLKNRLFAPFRFLWGLAKAIARGGRCLPLPEFSWQNLIGSIDGRSHSKRK